MVHYTYDASGNRTTRTVLSGAHAEYDNDELNRIRAQANYFANGQMGRFDYGFDVLGRRKYEQRDWGTADGYQYNARDEVTGYQRDGDLNMDGTVSASFWNNTGIQYDNNGNRIQVTGSGAASYTHNNLNQYGNVSNMGDLGYDPKGNLNYAAGWTYTYDAQNRLTRMETGGTVIVQTYDPLNRVITRSVNGAVTQNVWQGWNLIEEHRPDWSIQRCYLQGANQNEMVAAFDGGVYSNHWFWQDGRGNTSHITGDNAALLEHYTYDLSGSPKFYDEWGNERFGGSAYDTRFLFSGSQYLPDTGLYDMRNRFYSPTLNRFLQTDPTGFAGDPNNMYRYCGNDPVNGSDPFGLAEPGEDKGESDEYGPYSDTTRVWVRSTEIPINPFEDSATRQSLDLYSNFMHDFNSRGDRDPFSFGDNLVAPTYFQPTEPRPQVDGYRDFGPSSDELTPLQAGLIGLYLTFHGDIREGLLPRAAAFPSSPMGRSGNPMVVKRGTNTPGNINGRDYSGHAFDQMQGRGLMPSATENTIRFGIASPGNKPGTLEYYEPVNNLTVVTDTSGRVITVRPGH